MSHKSCPTRLIYKTTIHKGGATYTGKGTSREAADKETGDKYRKGYKDRT